MDSNATTVRNCVPMQKIKYNPPKNRILRRVLMMDLVDAAKDKKKIKKKVCVLTGGVNSTELFILPTKTSPSTWEGT
jgi:hypothetical protein